MESCVFQKTGTSGGDTMPKPARSIEQAEERKHTMYSVAVGDVIHA